MSMIVKFWGVRGAIPVPGATTHIYGGNTPCVEIRAGDAVLVCDAGSGIRQLNDDLARRKSAVHVHLFLSHTHLAHVQGLPFLRPPGPVTVHSSASSLAVLKRMFADDPNLAASEAGGRLAYAELNGRAVEIEGVGVQAFALNHPGECRGFVFEANGRKVVYIPDNELPIQKGDTFPDPEHEALLMRQMPRELLGMAQGANLLIMDAQYTDEEYVTRRGAGHSSCFSVTDFALQAGAQQLALFHHDPRSSDFDLEDRARWCTERAAKFGAHLTIFPAREGMAIAV